MAEKVADIAIVGSGPAGMATALEAEGMNIVMIESGKKREWGDKNIASGFGGAGASTDGKLNLSPEIGGQLGEILSPKDFDELAQYVDGLHLKFGADPSRFFEGDREKIAELKKKARAINKLTLVNSPLRHLGTENAFRIVENIYENLNQRGVKILLESPVTEIKKTGDIFELSVSGKHSDSILAKNIVVAPGRGGQAWWEAQAKKLGLKLTNTNRADIGVRVEVGAETLKEYTDAMYESKFIYYCSTDEKIRTFCMCPYGKVTLEPQTSLGFTTVNGHSYAEEKSDNTNFAVLFTLEMRDPFKDPIGYAIGMAQNVNRAAGGGVVVQRLQDLRSKRSSTTNRIRAGRVKPTLAEPYAFPGDLRLSIYPRILDGLLEILEVLEPIVPGINSDDTLAYGVEIKLYSVRTETNPLNGFETAIPGLRVIGDGSGWTRSLMQAWMTGIIAARAIKKN